MTNKRKKEHTTNKQAADLLPPMEWVSVLANSPPSDFRQRLADRRDLLRRLNQTDGSHGTAAPYDPANPPAGPRPSRSKR